jgi:hypothetical protein
MERGGKAVGERMGVEDQNPHRSPSLVSAPVSA